MNNKVKVSHEVAEAINDRLKHHAPSEIVAFSASNGWEERGESKVKCLNKRHLDLDILIKALYIGYEIKSTPEEMIFADYNTAIYNIKNDQNLDYWMGYRNAILNTLNFNDVKIKGVNV